MAFRLGWSSAALYNFNPVLFWAKYTKNRDPYPETFVQHPLLCYTLGAVTSAMLHLSIFLEKLTAELGISANWMLHPEMHSLATTQHNMPDQLSGG